MPTHFNHKIILRKEERKALAEEFGISQSVVSNCLNFRRNRKDHALIRSYAMNVLNGILFIYSINGKTV